MSNELGRKLERMAEVVDRQQGILQGILTVLATTTDRIDKLWAISEEHRRELDQHDERLRRMEKPQ